MSVLGTYVEARRTPFTPYDLAQGIELAFGGDGKVSPGKVAVLMAHTALETGRDVAKGLIGPACYHYNLGNVKAAPSWGGKYCTILLNEYLVRNNRRTLVWFAPQGELTGGPGSALVGAPLLNPPGHPQTRMRAFDTLEEGLQGKRAFMSQPRFAQAMAAAELGDADGYVRAIHAQKYFTAALDPYRRAVISLAKSYRPIAEKVAFTPLILPVAEEGLVDACIKECSRSIHHPAPLLDLSQTWQDQFEKDRRKAVLESS